MAPFWRWVWVLLDEEELLVVAGVEEEVAAPAKWASTAMRIRLAIVSAVGSAGTVDEEDAEV